MHHRQYLILTAVLAIAACDSVPRQSTPAETGFTSDRIDVATRGSGPDIVLIHGLAAHRDVWTEVADSLDDRYRLHVVQVNGFGGFDPGANADELVSAPVAEEVARYIRDMRLERPAIIGHSMGGAIGMMVAARHPDAVGRLMVVDERSFSGATEARLVRISDSNHYIQVDTPGRFVAEVDVFMRASELSALHRLSSDIRVFSNVWTQ